MPLESLHGHGKNQLLRRSSFEELTTVLMVVYAPLASGIGWGIVAWLAFECIPLLVKRARAAQDTKSRRWQWFYVTYVAIMLCLGTLCVVCYAVMPQVYFARNYNFAAGAQSSSLTFEYPQSAFVIINVSNWISTSMADALMVWRCCMLYQGQPRVRYIKTGLGVLFLIATASDLLCMITYSLPDVSNISGGPWATAVARWYFFVATFLNLAATSLMVIRLYAERRFVHSMMGPTFEFDARLNYTGISAMMIESCMLITLCSISYLILSFMYSPFRLLVIAAVDEVQIIAPLLVIWRIARGVAWTHESRDTVADLEIAIYE